MGKSSATKLPGTLRFIKANFSSAHRGPVVPSGSMFTSEHTLRKTQKGRHFVSFFLERKTLLRAASAHRISFGRCYIRCERHLSASDQTPWRTCTEERSAISAGVRLTPTGRTENELCSMTRQCVAGRRFADIDALRDETSAWSLDVNNLQRGGDWQMNFDDARTKLRSIYPKIKL